MIEINRKNEFVDKILGLQNIENVEYLLSPYILVLEYKSVFLLYNVLTKQLLEISEDQYKQFKTSVFSTDFKKFLIENWFMFSKKVNPKNIVNQLRNLLKTFSIKNDSVSYTIFTTTACNARCFYCYQAGTPIHTMSEKTALELVNYMERHRDNKPLRLRWFGGEPLCNIRAIDIICQKLVENGTEFTSTIVSNGYLFNKSTCKKAKELWKLTDAQITIDGLDKTYNSAKNYVYKNDDNPFKTVLGSIKNLLDEDITVDIRMNIDKHNFDELQELIIFLDNHFKEYKNLNLYCRPLFENVGYIKTIRNDLDRIELTMKFKEMEQFIDRLGRRGKTPLSRGFRLYSCMADDPNNCFISPEGNIGNCEHYPDSDFCGNIFNDDKIIPWNKYIPDTDECENCIAYPICRRLVGCNEHPECYEFEKYILEDKLRHGVQAAYDRYCRKRCEK